MLCGVVLALSLFAAAQVDVKDSEAFKEVVKAKEVWIVAFMRDIKACQEFAPAFGSLAGSSKRLKFAQVQMDKSPEAWALGVQFNMHKTKLPHVMAIVSTDANEDTEELVSGGEAPSLKVLKKRLKRALKGLSKGDDGYFLKSPKVMTVKAVCESGMEEELKQVEANALAKETEAVSALRNKDTRTRIGLITLATGKTWGTVGMKWLASANKYFCADKERFNVHLLLLTDMPTLAHIQAAHHDELQALTNAYVWPHVVKVGWPEDSINRWDNILDSQADKWVSIVDTSKEKEILMKSFDYIWLTDADQLFLQDTCEDLFGSRVVVQHAHFWDKRLGYGGPFHTGKITSEHPMGVHVKGHMPQPKSYMYPYLSAHIYGGRVQQYLDMLRALRLLGKRDFSKGKEFVPVYHDESYLNYWYSLPEQMPTVLLSRAFKWHEDDKECQSIQCNSGQEWGYAMEYEFCTEYCSKLSRHVIESLLKNKLAARKEGTKKKNVCTDLTCINYVPKITSPTDCELMHERLGHAKKTLIHSTAVLKQLQDGDGQLNDGHSQRPTSIAFVSSANDRGEVKKSLKWLESAKSNLCTDSKKYDLKLYLVLSGSVTQDDVTAHLSSLTEKTTIRLLWLDSQTAQSKNMHPTAKALTKADRSYSAIASFLSHSLGEVVVSSDGTASGASPFTGWADINSNVNEVDVQDGSPPEELSFDAAYITEPSQVFESSSSTGDVCDDILGVRVAVSHASFWDKKRLRSPGGVDDGMNGAFPHEKTGAAKIHHKKFEMNPWFSISMFGGRTSDTVTILTEMEKLKAADEQAGTIVKRGGESYLNAVLSRPEFTPTSELSRAFNWFESEAKCKKMYMSPNNKVIHPAFGAEYCTKIQGIVRRA